MNVLNLLTGVYARLHNYPGVPFWVLTPFRKLVRGIANKILPYYLSQIHSHRKMNGKGVVISFTSFPARINDVWKVVESLKNQSIRPERIILWLSKVQFPTSDSIPRLLKECVDDLFEIRMVDGDIRSHKKYFYAMREFPDKTIVTCDDDIYYHQDMLRNLLEASQAQPDNIIANTSKRIKFDNKGEVMPYAQWDKTYIPFAKVDRVQIGLGGVLYPPNSLHELVLRDDLFTELAPLADDLWLNMMARLKKTPIVQSGRNILPLCVKSDSPSLKSVNTGAENMNDVQIRNMRRWLKENEMPDVYSYDYRIEEPVSGGGKIIVSLTSFPARINNVWQVIICMLNQTLKPHKIILWLSKDQFPAYESIPESLRRLENGMFQIKVVDGDIRSHKKYYYAAKEYPDDWVFLIDDDIYYPTTILERTWKAHNDYPDSIISNYGYIMTFDNSGKIDSYRRWEKCNNDSDSDDLFFGSGGGTLIKPSNLYHNLTDIDLAMKLTPSADDIWLNAMAKLARVKLHMISHGLFLPMVQKGDVRLVTTNGGQSQNDVQIALMEEYFGKVFSKK